jgi:ribosomal protein S18 acetylase RimI-like enzyme
LFSSQCHALSLLAGLQNTDATKTLRNEAGITVDIARIPQDLPKIRECRATVDFANKKNLMDSQRRFLEATSVSDGKLKAICVVARGKDGMILGTTDCRIGGKSVTVNNVFVRPDQRGNGIGYLMMEGVEHLVMSQLGATKMTLDVDTNNRPAVKLYEKCGFKISDPANALVSGISSLTGASLQVCMTKNVDAN